MLDLELTEAVRTGRATATASWLVPQRESPSHTTGTLRLAYFPVKK